MLGVLNIESPLEAPLDEGDLDTMTVVGDRVAAALALGRERQALQERAELFGRLARFGSAINASLEPATAHESIIGAVADMLLVDITTLILRDPTTGEDRIVAIRGGDERYVGRHHAAGRGQRRDLPRGGPRRERGPDHHARRLSGGAARARVPDVLVTASFPLLRDNVVIGAVNVIRLDLARVFTPWSRDDGDHRLADPPAPSSTRRVHAQMAEAAIRDPLTGLWNRRELTSAWPGCSRAAGPDGPEAASSGGGHHVRPGPVRSSSTSATGTRPATRSCARSGAILNARLGQRPRRPLRRRRVPRHPGRRQPRRGPRVAEQIRHELETLVFPGSDASDLRATVSAGCRRSGRTWPRSRRSSRSPTSALQMAKRGGRNQVVAA